MKYLLIIKEQLKKFYGRFEVYITPTLKFLLALLAFSCINGKLGYMAILNRSAVVVIMALLCSFLPTNTVIVFSALTILAHCFKLSLYSALVVAVFFVLLLLLYFRFTPKDAVVVVLTPICFALKIPYVMPMAIGLVGTPASAVSVACGVIVYYVLDYVASSAEAITSLGTGADSVLLVIAYLIDGIMANKAMLMCAIAFAITVLVVYVVRMLSIDYSWFFAMVAGAFTNMIVMYAGDLALVTNVGIGKVFFGNIFAILICIILQFFVFNVDYNRTEHVQFEDDEYYYYVKAVPKVVVRNRDITAEQKAERAKERERRAAGTAAARRALRGEDTSEDDDVRTYTGRK